MAAKLLFESRSVTHIFSQDRAAVSEPLMQLSLELTDAPNIYASDSSLINVLSWNMTIQKHSPTSLQIEPLGWITYMPTDSEPQCMIEVHQTSERYFLLLEMFTGGYVSEITVGVDDVGGSNDYSRSWDTSTNPSIVIQSIRFEFPLPQSEA